MARFSDEQKAMLDEHMQRKICEAATGIIIESGIENVRMDKVAEAAGVAKGTIYNYFKDKNQLLATIAKTVFDPTFKNIIKIADSNSEALYKLQEIARILLESFSRHKKLFVLLHEAKIDKKPLEKRNQLISIIEKIIEPAINDGQFLASHPLVVAEIFLGMVMSINISKITTGIERPAQEDLDAVMSIFTKGIQQNLTEDKGTENEN